MLEDESCCYLMGLVPVTETTSSNILKALLEFLDACGITERIMQDQFVAFCICSDGASNMMGRVAAVATLLKNSYPRIQIFYCMAHRLELDVKNAVDYVNGVSHFRSLIDELYKVYSLSPKKPIRVECNSVREWCKFTKSAKKV